MALCIMVLGMLSCNLDWYMIYNLEYDEYDDLYHEYESL